MPLAPSLSPGQGSWRARIGAVSLSHRCGVPSGTAQCQDGRGGVCLGTGKLSNDMKRCRGWVTGEDRARGWLPCPHLGKGITPQLLW